LQFLFSMKIMSLNAQTKVMGANVKLAGAMTTATQSMTAMNKVMKPEQLSKTMQDFGKASAKMDMTEEMMNDALGIKKHCFSLLWLKCCLKITFKFDDSTWSVPDDILNESGDEEACDDIVQGVLDEIGIDISSKVILISLPYKLNITS